MTQVPYGDKSDGTIQSASWHSHAFVPAVMPSLHSA